MRIGENKSHRPYRISFSSNVAGVWHGYRQYGLLNHSSADGNAGFAAANPVTQSFTVPFGDVASTDHYFARSTFSVSAGITAGYGNNGYCPQQNATRDQMAIFVVRAIFGGDNFTYSTTPYSNVFRPILLGVAAGGSRYQSRGGLVRNNFMETVSSSCAPADSGFVTGRGSLFCAAIRPARARA